MAAVARGPWTPADIRAGMFLYAVTDSAWLHGRTLAACVQQAIDGGATFVQLREKHMTTDELVAEAVEVGKEGVCHMSLDASAGMDDDEDE